MKLNRARLLESVETAITAHRTAYDAEAAAWAQRLADHRAAWVDRWGAAWLEAADLVRDKINRGEVITPGDLPRSSGGSGTATYSTPYVSYDDAGPHNPGAYVEPVALRALRTTLAAIDDDTVTVSGLRQLGVTSTTMQSAIAHLDQVAPK